MVMTLGFRPALVKIAKDNNLTEYYFRHILKNNDGIWVDGKKLFSAILERCMLLAMDLGLQENRSPHIVHLRTVVGRMLRAVSFDFLRINTFFQKLQNIFLFWQP